MKSEVFNNSIGTPYGFSYPTLTKQEEDLILAGLFEQLLIFDKITIRTDRLNFALAFLINRLGLTTVERLLDSGYVKLLLWTPMIFITTGTRLDSGEIDESTIYGRPPIVSGSLSPEDLDPENNIKKALNHFNFPPKQKREFAKKALNNYIIPNGMEFSSDSAKIVIDAYQNNSLQNLGLPYEKDPNNLNVGERNLLLGLGNTVIETALLSKYNFKSYDNYEHVEIVKQNLSNIGKGYNIANNTSTLFQLENLPNLKELYLQEKLGFDQVFKIRHLSSAKYYRNWINEVGENSNAKEITTEYLKEIKGGKHFLEKTSGKFLKNGGVFGIGAALGTAIAGPIGMVAGYALSLLDTFWLDTISKGKNPSMFIDDIKNKVDSK
jgi:hypothetical protein